MRIFQSALAVVMVMGLSVSPAASEPVAHRRWVTPLELQTMSRFLIDADRAVITLVSGAKLEGQIHGVRAESLALRVKDKDRPGHGVLETIAVGDVQQILVKHVRASDVGFARRVGVALGFAAGVPVTSYAAQRGSGVGAWMALIGFPVLGGIAGGRVVRETRQTVIVVQNDTTQVENAEQPHP